MPPAAAPQPSPAEREELTRWMRSASEYVDPQVPVDPGPSLIRRLTRDEYAVSLREVSGLSFFNASDFVNFPDNEVAQGYDNLAEALSLSPALVDKLFAAADRALELWKSGLVEKADPALALADWQHNQAREAVKRLLFVQPSDTLSPREAADQIVARFLRRAYRRPASRAEIDRLLVLYEKLVEQGESFSGATLGAAIRN